MEGSDVRGLKTLPWLKLADGVLEAVAELEEFSSVHLRQGLENEN